MYNEVILKIKIFAREKDSKSKFGWSTCLERPLVPPLAVYCKNFAEGS